MPMTTATLMPHSAGAPIGAELAARSKSCGMASVEELSNACSEVLMRAAPDAGQMLIRGRGGQIRGNMIEVQMFEKLEANCLENVGVLQHCDRVPAPGSR